MNWILVLTILGLCVNAAASIYSFLKREKTALGFTLTATLVSAISLFAQKRDYSSEVPAITASIFGNSIKIIAVDVDKELPLKDVSVKLQGSKALNIGTMNPQVVNEIANLEIPSNNATWVLVIWYNGTESREVNFEIVHNPDSSVTINTKYFDKGVEFTPDWKIRAAKNPNTSQHTYNPELFK